MKITIQRNEPTSDGKPDGYRAVVHLGKYLPGCHGSATEEGPWMPGYGQTPDDALRNLYERIGRAYVLSLEAVSQ